MQLEHKSYLQLLVLIVAFLIEVVTSVIGRLGYLLSYLPFHIYLCIHLWRIKMYLKLS